MELFDHPLIKSADRIHHRLVDEEPICKGSKDDENDGSCENQRLLPGDVQVQGVDDDMVEYPPVQQQDRETVFSEHHDQGIPEMFSFRLFVQGEGEDAAGHENGKRSHVDIVVDISLPVHIRVHGQDHFQKGQQGSNPDPTVVGSCLRAGYPVADHGDADPLGEKGQQVRGHGGVGPKKGTQQDETG